MHKLHRSVLEKLHQGDSGIIKIEDAQLINQVWQNATLSDEITNKIGRFSTVEPESYTSPAECGFVLISSRFT